MMSINRKHCTTKVLERVWMTIFVKKGELDFQEQDSESIKIWRFLEYILSNECLIIISDGC